MHFRFQCGKGFGPFVLLRIPKSEVEIVSEAVKQDSQEDSQKIRRTIRSKICRTIRRKIRGKIREKLVCAEGRKGKEREKAKQKGKKRNEERTKEEWREADGKKGRGGRAKHGKKIGWLRKQSKNIQGQEGMKVGIFTILQFKLNLGLQKKL